MLVLARRQLETIRIGDDIIVTIIEVHGECVKLGIEAPNDVPVHRSEVYEAIKQQQQRDGRPRLRHA